MFYVNTSPGPYPASLLEVEEAHVMGVLLNEFITGLNLIAHKLADHALAFSAGIFDAYLKHGAGRGLHGGLPQLLGVHFAQTLVTLQ